MSQELQLLAEALSTQGEAEQDGVKYIYMDDSTIYRFENNRMKKVSAALIKKATKLLTQQDPLSSSRKAPSTSRSASQRKQAKKEADEDMSENEEEPEDRKRSGERKERSDWSDTDEPKPKSVRKQQSKRSGERKERSDWSELDVEEYYNNKAKLEYQALELSRLTNKVNKLKQYKSIVNKITGGEFDMPGMSAPPSEQPPEPVQEPQNTPKRPSGSLFDWY